MQDISRDDFSLLNGGCEKDIIVDVSRLSTTPSRIATTTISPSVANIPVSSYNGCSNRSPRSQRAYSPNLDTVVSSIKLEDCSNSDLYNTTPSWHHPHIPEMGSSSKLLLRNSDDPLISRGATTVVDDDNINEFKFIVNDNAQTSEVSNEIILPPENPVVITSTTTTKQHKKVLNKKSTKYTISTTSTGQPRTRRKGAFKLRFHHQALPAEYLSHYEESQNLLEARNAAAAAAAAANNYCNNKDKNNSNCKKTAQVIQQNKQEKTTNTTNENVRNWLQKISKMQAMAAKENNLNCNVKNVDKMEIDDDLVASKDDIRLSSSTPTNIQPQMSITTTTAVAQSSSNQHQKHQRIIKYSDLPYMGEMTLENSKPRRGRKPKKTDICHLIYKNYGTIFPGTPKALMAKNDDNIQMEVSIDNNGPEKISLLKKTLIGDITADNTIFVEEPLNLCLRDQSDSLTISSDEDESDDLDRSNSTTPINTPSGSVTDAFLAANLKMSLPNFQTAMLDKITSEDNINSNGRTGTSNVSIENMSSKSSNCWPNVNNLFIHPMALYYKQMIDSDSLPLRKPNSPTTSTTLLKKQQQSELSTKPLTKSPSPKLQLKKEKPEHPDTCSTPNSIKSFTSSSAATNSSQSHPPQKRKRSAIFIPPMPAENTTNPATEVSICKFKFTGGAKPSLQEKKMLSVDSDGNYRYYSGTGDKSTRGYEFFPRESLQQSGVIPGVNCSGAFLNATGEKISLDLPPSAGLSNELLQLPDTPPGALLLPSTATNRDHNNQHLSLTHSPTDSSSDRRKRKSRRSLQREKLEKTFKDQGFLIQTQQLESAEGATYCKFRQLKKFTRYLFRSWKDYLPGELPANPAVVAAAAAAAGVKVSTSKQQPLTTVVNPM